MRIDKVKVWFDDGTSGRIERKYMNWIWKNDPKTVHKILQYMPIGFNKRKDDVTIKGLKQSIKRGLQDFMDKYNKDFKK